MLNSLPNILTISRILAIPLIVALFWFKGDTARWVTLALFTLAGVTDYFDGLDPDIVLKESASTFGILGDVNEPLLARAILEIEASRSSFRIDPNPIEIIGGRREGIPFAQEMYIDKPLPNIIRTKLEINK